MYCDCITVILVHMLLSFKYYLNESIQVLLLCSRTILLLLLTQAIILLVLKTIAIIQLLLLLLKLLFKNYI